MQPLEQAWAALGRHRADIEGTRMRDMFAREPDRFERFSLTLGDMLFDYSKNRITGETVRLLLDLAGAAGVEAAREAMFAGQAINATEGRAVLHVALRNRSASPMRVDGADVTTDVEAVLARMGDFVRGVRSGALRGASGEGFTDIVNIGIGGSDLGPAMVAGALSPYRRADLRVHFVSNVDGAHLHDTLDGLDPARTLFLVASKTFTTLETMTNAASARAWLTGVMGESAVAEHFAALSTNEAAVNAFGIRTERMFGFWDWVGGRYSVWSAIGMPVALAIGFERFVELLEGAHAADRHFAEAPLRGNVPVLMALLGVWYRNVWGFPAHAVIPYDQRLERFPAYLQQADMESNGKSVRMDGSPVDVSTGPIVFGEPGTNAQHAFFQLLHQGTQVVPVDFLVAARAHEEAMGDHHEKLLANALAQSEALMRGRTREEARAGLEGQGLDAERAALLAAHKTFPGDRPSNTFLYRTLDPRTLGMLIALYEHKIFVQGTLWGINSFDQWGVELGKELASSLLPAVREGTRPDDRASASTRGLLERLRTWRER